MWNLANGDCSSAQVPIRGKFPGTGCFAYCPPTSRCRAATAWDKRDRLSAILFPESARGRQRSTKHWMQLLPAPRIIRAESKPLEGTRVSMAAFDAATRRIRYLRSAVASLASDGSGISRHLERRPSSLERFSKPWRRLHRSFHLEPLTAGPFTSFSSPPTTASR